MSEEKLLACPFCGAEESERDGESGIQHKSECYIILMETELPNSPRRVMAWNERAGGRIPTPPETGSAKGVGISDLLDANKGTHYAGCPALEGKPVCTCGGRCG